MTAIDFMDRHFVGLWFLACFIVVVLGVVPLSRAGSK
jgi:hypothetical protein